ncbi:MAG: phosphoribosylglycinamide formyltransferase [Bacilli bacterium]|nr:phosphoribosylglycinamide formyltransferase [Bacilli bacterium]
MKKEFANIAVFVSGGGTNLQAILDSIDKGIISSGKVTLVLSNKKGVYALERAKNHNIESLVVSKKELGSQEAFEDALLKALKERDIDLIVLAGFLAILSERFVKEYPNRIINVHPSLIPSFCGDGFYGLHVHEAALAKGVKVTGATVHFVNEITDGGKIILQKAVEVKEGDTPEILQRRVMEEAEWKILPQAVEMVSKQLLEDK